MYVGNICQVQKVLQLIGALLDFVFLVLPFVIFQDVCVDQDFQLVKHELLRHGPQQFIQRVYDGNLAVVTVLRELLEKVIGLIGVPLVDIECIL